MYLGGIDLTYLIFVLPALILSLVSSAMVKSRFAQYNKVATSKGITGAQAAEILMRANGITDVKITHISGQLTDNYNPTNKTLNLSDATYSSTSIAAVGVAAHETGHAIQYKVGYGPLKLRSTLVPVANIGSRFGPVLAIAGLAFGASNQFSEQLSIFQLITNIGLVLFGMSVLFYIVTLPVEFNASSRALKILKETGVFTENEEIAGAKRVLTAAAMTYVASALTAIGSFLRLLLITNSRNNRRR